MFMALLHSILAPILGTYFKFQSKRRLPTVEGVLEFYGLQDSVTINRDKWGIPHIQAISDEDLFFAQAIVHCQDRLFQMELNRRVAKGTISEIFGDVGVDTDRLARTLGFHRLGMADIELLEEETRTILESYVKGVNAYINHLDIKKPLEFGLIKYKPENWTLVDLMAISRMITWQMSSGWYSETIRSQLIDAVGEDHAALLDIHYHPENPVELPEGIEFNKIVKGKLKKATGPFLSNAMGSNAWAISKERSATGTPILCNDMHLPLRLPSVWYSNHLRSKDTNVSGVSFPGMPSVVVGHNGKIAWGITLSYNDCEDLFVEKFDTDNPNQYEFKGKMVEAEVLLEIIKVKDGLNQQQKVVITQHGPIISDFIETSEMLALQSRSLQPITTLNGFIRFNKAEGWDDFVRGVQQITAPSLNIMYADSENIGYYNSGEVPIRKKGDGRLPVPGWTGEYEWKGMIPFEEMPHTLNPEKGYLISCNNKIISDDYPHHLGENFMNGFRARRLEHYFAENEKIGFEECKKMQLDYKSEAVALFLEHYQDLEVTDPNPSVVKAFSLLKKFDGVLSPDSVAASLYEVTKHMTVRLLLEPHLGKELTNRYMGEGFHELLLPSNEFSGQDLVVILRLLEEDNWWVTHAGGKEKLLVNGFKRGFEWLMTHFGTDYAKWTWGKIHTLTFDHALSVQQPLDKIFSRGPYPVGGDDTTPNQMGNSPTSYGVTSWAPSWRQIVDLGDISRSMGMYSPGQSGQLASKHYDDLIEPWLQGDYFSLLWTRGQIESNRVAELTLKPRV
jgi:penicillin amidase